jgi:hypothetical protein
MTLLNEDKIILDLCGGTGAWSKPYADAGYDVRVITLPDNDVRIYKPPDNVYGILAAPPCVEFSIAKDWKLDRDFTAGMDVVNACYRIIHTANPYFYAVENPVGYLKEWLGQPTYIFHPWYFGDPWTKKTAIWGKFNKPQRIYHTWQSVPKNDKLYIRPGRKKPSIAFLHKSAAAVMDGYGNYTLTNDAEFRSITPPGFAKCFYEANR